MNKQKITASIAALAAGLGLGLGTPARAQAPQPCVVFLCMAAKSGYGSPDPSCAASLTYWSTPAPAGLAVYVYAKFVAPASYKLRNGYLNQCPGAATPNQQVLQSIMAQWGMQP
ncbi:MAG: hypothetical protein JSS56_20745 [Proteobacteria bacterium]|nr:hypothetical protein [Pseudomonadota bacterium]